MEEALAADLIPGLPNDLVQSNVLPGICWWDFAAARRVSDSWRTALDARHPLVRNEEIPPPPPCLVLNCEEKRRHGGREDRMNYASLVLGRKFIVAGGQSQECVAMDEVDMFDLDRKCWEPLPSLKTPLASCVMGVTSDNRIVIFGGVGSGDTFWVQTAQVLGYGDHAWTEVEEATHIPLLIQNCCCFGPGADGECFKNVAMIGLGSGGFSATLI